MNNTEKFNKVKKLIKKYGGDDVRISNRKHKKYDVLYKNNWISFGDNRYEDWLDHHNPKRRINYRKRAKGLRDGKGNLTYNNPYSANYWSYNILW